MSDPAFGIEAPPLPVSDDALLYAYARYHGQLAATPRVVTVANPAAGTDWTVTVSASGNPYATWIPLSIFATLTNSATVANRQANLAFTVSGTTVGQVPPVANAVASATIRYTWSRGASELTAVGGRQGIGLPLLALPSGSTISPLTVNLDATDQWSTIALYVLEVSQRTPADLTAVFGELVSGSPRNEMSPGMTLGL